MKEYNIEYLRKYISNETMKNLETLDLYILEDLTHNYVDVDLNVKYLRKYGITNFDKVIPSMIEYLLLSHNDFIEKIQNYEKTMSREEVISLIENM